MRRPLLLLLVLLSLVTLGGCGEDDESTSGSESPPVLIEEPSLPPVEAEPAEEPPDLEIELAPIEEDVDGEPPELQISIPEPEPKPAVKPAPVKRPAEKKAAEVELSAPELDLRLPEELAAELMPAPGGEPARLLPQLFDPTRSSKSMQVDGRLIPSEDNDEGLIDGAEIRFEFKR